MAHRQPGLSRTLPKDFTFYPVDPDGPRTPERPAADAKIPPPPHHASCRFRRRRLDIFPNPKNDQDTLCSPDIPLPSIEFPRESASFPSQSWSLTSIEPALSDRLQVPSRGRLAPKTPPAQILQALASERSSWTHARATGLGDSIARPSSACSTASDSSVSSGRSYTTQPSFGGSCTSPESEIQDPFITQNSSVKKQMLESPSRLGNAKARARSLEIPTVCRWTTEMDNHLWNTYQMYVQDPTITPFKMVPGSIPPLGVSHRVAREARRTWAKSKHRLSAKQPRPAIRNEVHPNADETPGAIGNTRSGSSTPTARAGSSKPVWPRSDASTRRRLKVLCKRKFSIAPHYQRLLQSRSPSPFLDPFSHHPSRACSRSSYSNATSFATRDLGVSLVSSSMSSDLPGPAAAANTFDSGADYLFNNPVRPRMASVRDGGKTLDDSPGSRPGDSEPVPRLGSPFMYNTWGPDSSHRRLRPTTPINQYDTIHVTGSRLRSPVRLDSFSNAHKRRAIHQLEDEISPGGNGIERGLPDLFRGERWKDVGHRRLRLRNRGVTVGALSSRARLDQIFSPPSPLGSNNNRGNLQSGLQGTHVSRPGDDIRRLGSPFDSDPLRRNKPLYHVPRHASSFSDPFIMDTIASQISSSASQELRPGFQQYRELSRPFDVSGEMSEAERTRREILKTPFS